MERQRHRRLARLSGQSGVIGAENSPRSIISGSSSSAHSDEEQKNLLMRGFGGFGMGTQRRKNVDETHDLLLQPNRPNIQAV
jgi:hypothetical protein